MKTTAALLRIVSIIIVIILFNMDISYGLLALLILLIDISNDLLDSNNSN